MLIPADVVQAFVDAGLQVRPGERQGAVDVVIESVDGQHASLRVRRYSSPLSGQDLEDLSERVGREVLVLVPRASVGARTRAETLGVSLVSLDRDSRDGPAGHVAWGPGDVTPVGGPQVREDEEEWRPRVAWGALAVRKALLLTSERRQTALSTMTGLSQPRVSQIFRDLTDAGLLRRDGVRASSVDVVWPLLSENWIEEYPGPGGASTFWFGLDPVVRQVAAVAEHLDGEGVGHLVSGDVAADHLAPWSTPALGQLYVRRAVDLGGLGFTPSSRADATLVLTVPEDPAVWQAVDWPGPHQTSRPEHRLADPLQVLVDVARSGGVDADQAAARLGDYVRRLVGPVPSRGGRS